MNQSILLHGALPKEAVNRLEGFKNILKGVAPLPDLQDLIGAAD
jgi:hypothetical protein